MKKSRPIVQRLNSYSSEIVVAEDRRSARIPTVILVYRAQLTKKLNLKCFLRNELKFLLTFILKRLDFS